MSIKNPWEMTSNCKYGFTEASPDRLKAELRTFRPFIQVRSSGFIQSAPIFTIAGEMTRTPSVFEPRSVSFQSKPCEDPHAKTRTRDSEWFCKKFYENADGNEAE